MRPYIVRVDLPGQHIDIEYTAVSTALHDHALRVLINDEHLDASASVWTGDLRVTRDCQTWAEFQRHLIGNSATVMRYVEGDDA